MERNTLSRRGFMRKSLAAAAAAGLPSWYARELVAADEEAKGQNKKGAANDRVVIGCIGIGSPQSRGLYITKNHAMSFKNVEIAAVCDVDGRHRDRAAAVIGGDPKKYSDFRELLDRKDIGAVIIATPDQWHALAAIDAMRKGKDVYCEKPLSLTVEEGRAIAKVAKETGRVFQVGSQQRSEFGGRFRLACELVRNGRLGKLKKIETRIGRNPEGTFKTAPVPRELDWDFWLGPTAKVEYVPERCHYTYRWWYDYSGGKMTDWGAHHNDIAQWALGMDDSGPVAVVGKGAAPSKVPNSYNCHPTFVVDYTYADGTKLHCTSDGDNGVRFEGEDGKWIFVSRGKIEASDKAILEEKLPTDAVRLYPSTSQMGNWIECIKTRKPTICTAEIGHRSATVCHIGVIATRLGKALKWDPVKEKFDDAEATAMLSRKMRAPWKLDV